MLLSTNLRLAGISLIMLEQVSLAMLDAGILAPFQSRLIPLSLTQSKNLPHANRSFHTLPIILFLSTGQELSLDLLLPASSPAGPLLSTFLSNTQVPSYSMYTPPLNVNEKLPGTILALHGAGLDPATTPEWTSSIPQRKNEWIVWPVGLTPWVSH